MAEVAERSEEPQLFGGYVSSCTYRVRIALNLKGIKVKYRTSGGDPEHRYTLEELEKLNSRKQVPVLVIDGVPLAESVAVIEYLEETRPDPPLLPKDPKQRAFVRKVVQHVNAGIQPLQNTAVLGKVADKLGPEERLQWAQFFIQQGLAAVEDEVKETAGTYCLGDQVTMADVFLAPQMFNAARYQVDTSQFPTLERICNELSTLPAFQDAHPANQIDAPKTGPLCKD